MFVVTYLDTATGLYNAEPFFEEEGAQGSVEAHKQFEDRYKEIKIREMTKEQFDELESEDFYDEFVTKGTIPGIETSGEEEEEMNLKEAFEEMAKVDIAPVGDTEVFVDGDIIKDEPKEAPSGPETGVDTTIADMIINAVNGEWDTIREYNGIISALEQANLQDFIPVIEDINNEEHKHIGQLQECLKQISPNTNSIASGEEEGAEQLKENLEDMPKLKLNESMEDLDELVADKELCAHADIPLRIATDWIFRKNLQKQHEKLFKDKDEKLAKFIKKQEELAPKTPKLELKESLFEAADVRDTVTIDMKEPDFITKKHELQDKGYTVLWSGNGKICMAKAKAITEALKKTKSLKESRSLKESSGIDVLYDLIDRAKGWVDDGDDAEEAVRHAIDDGLIYTEDIVALGLKYGAIDDSEIISNIYEELFDDMYKEVSDYYDEQKEEGKEENEEETQEESFRGIKPRKRLKENKSLKESNYRGAKGIKFVSHGVWSDPELIYKGRSFNYWDIEDALWSMFLEETGHTDNESNDPEVEAEFDEYVQAHAADYLEDVIAGGYFEESRRSNRKGKALKESDEVLVFTQTPDDDVYVDFEDYVGDAAFEDGVVISGNRDFKEFGDDKLLKIVKGNYEGDENWNEEEQYYEDYDVIEMLKKVTGKDYVKNTMTGYSQSDWQNIYYPKGMDETADYIEMLYMGKYDEFCNDEEGCIVVPHDVSWKGKEAVRKYIAREIGERPENIKVRMFNGYSRTANYDESLKESLRRKRKLKEARNSTDKFTAVYDELVSSKAGKTPFRKLKNKEEDRYDYTQVTYDDDGIIVRADSEEELDFAKEVAKAWNCETVVKNDRTMKHPFGLVLKVDEKEKVSK